MSELIPGIHLQEPTDFFVPDEKIMNNKMQVNTPDTDGILSDSYKTPSPAQMETPKVEDYSTNEPQKEPLTYEQKLAKWREDLGIKPPDKQQEELAQRNLKRRAAVNSLSDAFRVLGQSIYGNKGYLVPKDQPNLQLAKTQAELQRRKNLYTNDLNKYKRNLITSGIEFNREQEAEKAREQRQKDIDLQRQISQQRYDEQLGLSKERNAESKRHNIEMEGATGRRINVSDKNAESNRIRATKTKSPKIVFTLDDDKGNPIHYTQPEFDVKYAKVLKAIKNLPEKERISLGIPSNVLRAAGIDVRDDRYEGKNPHRYKPADIVRLYNFLLEKKQNPYEDEVPPLYNASK